jgi:2-polyprenyl-6-hydroxyphenyl methylase/3-demethylubiquinone-9 3-methyltransferase
MRKSELYFEELGDNFDAFMSSYDVQRRLSLINRLISKGSPKGTALEVGCGTGAITPALLNRGLTVTIGDISAKLAETTAARYGVTGVECDATAIPFPDKSVDLVLSSEVIEHVPDPRRALQEMCRVLKGEGLLIVTSPNKLWFPLLWIAQKVGARNFSGNEIWLWPTEARKIIEDQGCKILEMNGCHLFPWQIPLAKKALPILDKLSAYLWPFMINWAILAQRDSSS